MERNPHSVRPRLLVSVRSAKEAYEAISGGCDILDVKEPKHGSLGAAPASVIREVSRIGNKAGIPVSAALGECAGWRQSTRSLDLNPVSESGLRFVKLGLAGMGHRKNWFEEWLEVTGSCVRKPSAELQHVAVLYADWQAAQAPHPKSILESLSKHIRNRRLDADFVGVLVDTFEKSSGRLLDAMSMQALYEIREQTLQMELFLALAGRLNEESLPPLVELAPDIIAVRSAACRGEDRIASVDRGAVSQFRTAMQSHFESPVKTAPVTDGARHA